MHRETRQPAQTSRSNSCVLPGILQKRDNMTSGPRHSFSQVPGVQPGDRQNPMIGQCEGRERVYKGTASLSQLKTILKVQTSSRTLSRLSYHFCPGSFPGQNAHGLPHERQQSLHPNHCTSSSCSSDAIVFTFSMLMFASPPFHKFPCGNSYFRVYFPGNIYSLSYFSIHFCIF